MKIFFIISILFFILGILNPSFYLPWSSFLSEYLVFLSFLCLLPVLFKKDVTIPKKSIFFLLLSFVPIVQYSFGLIIFLDKAILSFLYLFCFWLAVLVGYNSGKNYNNTLDLIYGTFLICGLISSLIAILQWLDIGTHSDFIMRAPNRPFANLGQPNHLSTFLILALISCLYFFENKVLNDKVLIVFSIIFLITISITQSRTAWVILFFLALYWIYNCKKNILNFSEKRILLYMSIFIVFVFSLPKIKSLFIQSHSISMFDRVSSGYERIEIWLQAVDAMKKQPLIGYGWNQSSFAQFETIQVGFINNRLTSFHNIILDIVIWCGIPIGFSIVLFFLFLLIKYLLQSSTSSQVFSISSIFVVVIHGLFEFPLSYSYFLFPIGLFLGYLFFSFRENYIFGKGFIFIFVFLLGLFFSFYVFLDYSKIPDNMVAAEEHEMNERKYPIILPYENVFFETFEQRSKWVSLYPCTKLNKDEINDLNVMVKTYMIYYDLYKSSNVLVYNGYLFEAERNIRILNYMYGKSYILSDLSCFNSRV